MTNRRAASSVTSTSSSALRERLSGGDDLPRRRWLVVGARSCRRQPRAEVFEYARDLGVLRAGTEGRRQGRSVGSISDDADATWPVPVRLGREVQDVLSAGTAVRSAARRPDRRAQWPDHARVPRCSRGAPRSPPARRRQLMGKRKKKNSNLGPRRKRMRRPARLMAAVKWRAGYGGKNIVRGYARWFGVDLIARSPSYGCSA